MCKDLVEIENNCRKAVACQWPGKEKTLVFGCGREKTPSVMLVGEAPGEQEVLLGMPFVGKAGKNLTAFLDAIELRRDSIYITNVVKIRPTKLSLKKRVVNRPPTKEEILFFLPYLIDEIACVKPKLLVTMGNVALKALLSEKSIIGERHGRTMSVQIEPSKGDRFEIELFALYHPASVIYNRTLTEVYQADLQKLRKQLLAD